MGLARPLRRTSGATKGFKAAFRKKVSPAKLAFGKDVGLQLIVPQIKRLHIRSVCFDYLMSNNALFYLSAY